MIKTLDISNYRTLIFDCDGVILDSNRVKSDAFYRAALLYGEKIASAFMDYHQRHGGISRYKKFEYLFSNILQQPPNEGEIANLLLSFATYVQEGLLSCTVAEGLDELREITPNARWLVVSGGDQAELRQIFMARHIAGFFDGGIFGAPDSKDEILARKIDKGIIINPAVFIGDSRYDHQASERAGLDFIFVTQWTEFQDWEHYFQAYEITYANTIGQLV